MQQGQGAEAQPMPTTLAETPSSFATLRCCYVPLQACQGLQEFMAAMEYGD